MLSQAEIDKVKAAVEEDDGIQAQAYSRDDGKSRRSRVSLWNHPGDDITGRLARMYRVAGTMEEAQKVLEHVYVEMKAGDMLFFHCNLLHTSDQNSSDLRRWVFIVAFNKRSNNPYKEHHHPQYTPMTKVLDSALMECDGQESLEGKWFMKLNDDISIRDKVH